ncbi:MAG: hypothetical protein Fur0022_26470 [Anaerolineales bacterium]
MTTLQIQRAKSQTHEHLLSIVHTEALSAETGRTIKILDAGCGDGHLMAYLAVNLPKLNSSLTYDIYGFDVNDHGVQNQGYFDVSVQFLNQQLPDVPWKNKLALIRSTDPWPYPDQQFDVILSNQVLEHVKNHTLFFSEIYRTLRTGGFSVHLFPLAHHIVESHLLLPFVHWIKDFNLLRATIKGMSWAGLGKYPAFKRDLQTPLDDFSERHADFIYFYTNYLRAGDVLNLAKKYHLRGSFKYTQEYYWRKLGAILKFTPQFTYKPSRSAFADWLAFSIFKYVASVTLFLEKKETYTSQSH